ISFDRKYLELSSPIQIGLARIFYVAGNVLFLKVRLQSLFNGIQSTGGGRRVSIEPGDFPLDGVDQLLILEVDEVIEDYSGSEFVFGDFESHFDVGSGKGVAICHAPE